MILFWTNVLLFHATVLGFTTVAPDRYYSQPPQDRFYSQPSKSTQGGHNYKLPEKDSFNNDRSGITYDKQKYLGDVMKYFGHYHNPPAQPPPSMAGPGNPPQKTKAGGGGFGKIDISIEYGCCASTKNIKGNQTGTVPGQPYYPEHESPNVAGTSRFESPEEFGEYGGAPESNFESNNYPSYMSYLNNNNKFTKTENTRIKKKNYFTENKAASSTAAPHKESVAYSIQQPFYPSTMAPLSRVSLQVPNPSNGNNYYRKDNMVPAIPVYSTQIIQPVAVPVQDSYYMAPKLAPKSESQHGATFYDTHVTPRSILHEVSKIVIEDVPYSYKQSSNYRNPATSSKNNIINTPVKFPSLNTGHRYNQNTTYFPPKHHFQPKTNQYLPKINSYNPGPYNNNNNNNNALQQRHIQHATHQNAQLAQNASNYNFNASTHLTNSSHLPTPNSKYPGGPKGPRKDEFDDDDGPPKNDTDLPSDIAEAIENFEIIQKKIFEYFIKATLKDFQKLLKKKIESKKVTVLDEEKKILDDSDFDDHKDLIPVILDFLTLYERHAQILDDNDLKNHILHDIDRAREYINMKLNKFRLELDSFETKEEFLERFNHYKQREKPPGLMNVLYHWYDMLSCKPDDVKPEKIKQDLINVMKDEKRYWLLLLRN